jgi:hypothetical protein
VSPVKYELIFTSQKTAFFIDTAVKTSNLTQFLVNLVDSRDSVVRLFIGMICYQREGIGIV